ncbi:unnamed protein product [Arctia plantaginis]|uniref:Uncharacterized protein n=1 Tax=Arctia plantaginis TaxID=874455 RepID=A0A8S0YNE9_ARCPL|nr:unnamed protein product [Arctia plantaginis]CAB3261625.1 unnamed protein product [Arctia plantaginis]
MVSYDILERENVPEVLQSKPRWMACVIIAATVMTITMSAVAAGAFIGYTYCYLEHRHSLATGNLTHSTSFQIVHVPLMQETENTKKNRTINSALSSVLVSRILKIGHALLDEEISSLPWASEVPEVSQPTL